MAECALECNITLGCTGIRHNGINCNVFTGSESNDCGDWRCCAPVDENATPAPTDAPTPPPSPAPTTTHPTPIPTAIPTVNPTANPTVAATTRSVGIGTRTNSLRLLPANTIHPDGVDLATASTDDTAVAGSAVATVSIGIVVVTLMVYLGLVVYMRMRQRKRHVAPPMDVKRVAGFDAGGVELPSSIDGVRPETLVWDVSDTAPAVTTNLHEEVTLARRGHRLTTALTGESCTEDDADEVAYTIDDGFQPVATSQYAAELRDQGSRRRVTSAAGHQGGVAGEDGIVGTGEADVTAASQLRLTQPMASAALSVASTSSMGTVQDWDRVMREHIDQRVATAFIDSFCSEAGTDDPAAQRPCVSPGLPPDQNSNEYFDLMLADQTSGCFDGHGPFALGGAALSEAVSYVNEDDSLTLLATTAQPRVHKPV